MFSEDSLTILNRMLENVPSDVNKSEGSLIYDALSPASQALAKSELLLDEVLKMVFAQSAAANGYSTELRLRCTEFGVTPKDGTTATGQVTFTGVETTPIPLGTTVQTPGGLRYITTALGVITGGVVTVMIQAVDVGTVYNVPENTVIQIPAAISGITGVNNSSPITGGNDAETDDALLSRLLSRARTPSTSGNVAHYVQWAIEVPGIGAARVYPLWNGPGTVKVVAIDSNKRAINSSLLSEVTEHIEDNRPIGATVTVVSATEKLINLSATVVLSNGITLNQVQDTLGEVVTEYLKSIAFLSSHVSFAQVGSLLLSVLGVSDYSNLQMNGLAQNMIVGEEEVAVLGVLSLGV
ncbi:Phage-like element PBSX protein xkdT [Desulfosporosinus sp. I2]|uniref:baseplate J/gp47 family protein n=1 Tax=Desulfosporosinus sp. I2 TaxID=1617025 RepID=UPI0005ED4FD3|nr:baseplate J/gp47 family protein [Desulfosporosinus sp. I2]KJR48393.1 Phage-like element PBSX protein xkdT [Desulfosporosinus sp. I2]